MVLFRCTVPGRTYVKKNGAKVYRGKLIYTPQYRAWETTAILYVIQAFAGSGLLMPIDKKMNMKALFYFENRASEPDLSALYEGIQDVLQKVGVILNDRLIYSHDGSTKIIGPMAKLEVELSIRE